MNYILITLSSILILNMAEVQIICILAGGSKTFKD